MNHPHLKNHPGDKDHGRDPNILRLVAWETTRRCNLSCKHCRAVAEDHPYDNELDAQQYEETLNWFYDKQSKTRLQLKATWAPHYYRILRQRARADGKKVTFETHGLDAVTRGCLAGKGFCFISHVGRVQTCGFLDVNCGNITQQSFKDIWENSTVFNELRDLNHLENKCGRCEYKRVCGGCRARAYEASGSYLEKESLCSYQPRKAALKE